jgi:anti-sigma B factor antagonist
MTQVPQEDFTVSVERSATTAIVHVAGELDLATAPQLAEALSAVEGQCDRIILDVSGLEFMDSTGLRLVVTQHRRATTDGFEFVVAGAAGAVFEVLRLTGLDVTLPLAPDVRSALSSVRDDGHRR